MAAPSSDKVLIAAGALLVLLSAAAFGTLAMRHPHSTATEAPTVQLATAAYTPMAPEAPAIKPVVWEAPRAQARGRDWIYDLFTPPEIYYNRLSKQFTVKPPSSLVEEGTDEPFGVELVAVKPEPFRLQLFGFVGEEGKWRGMFQNVRTGEVFVAAGGRAVPNLKVTIKQFDVKRQPIALAESMTTQQFVASALVRDDVAQRDVVLTNRERVFTGTTSAFVAEPGESTTREVRAGDTFKIGDATYRIEKVELSPPSIEVTKESPNLGQPLRQVLTPREPETAEPAEPLGGGSQ